MARYINAEQMKGDIKIAMANQQLKDPRNLLPTHLAELFCHFVDDTPTADVVPRAEVERLQSQVNRLKKYDEERDIALHARLIANTRQEVAREIWAEIDVTWSERCCVSEFFENLADLKKKYTGEERNNR